MPDLRVRICLPSQVLFLLYHYFAAAEMYNAIRVYIAAYVWMTGFGNFLYYYKTNDFSFVRCGRLRSPCLWVWCRRQVIYRITFYVSHMT